MCVCVQHYTNNIYLFRSYSLHFSLLSSRFCCCCCCCFRLFAFAARWLLLVIQFMRLIHNSNAKLNVCVCVSVCAVVLVANTTYIGIKVHASRFLSLVHSFSCCFVSFHFFCNTSLLMDIASFICANYSPIQNVPRSRVGRRHRLGWS